LSLTQGYAFTAGMFDVAHPVPGFGNLPPKHRDFSPRETTILRGTALFEPNEIYDARLKVSYVDDRMEGSGGDGQLILCPDGTGGVAPRNFAFIGDADCKLDKNTQLADFDPAFWPGIRNAGVPFMDSNQT
jgi:iron complex outermembrane receptor protein